MIRGWRWAVTCAEGAPPPLRARGKAGRRAQIEQGDQGGGLEGGQSALGGVVFGGDTYHGSSLFPCTFGGNIFKAMFWLCC